MTRRFTDEYDPMRERFVVRDSDGTVICECDTARAADMIALAVNAWMSESEGDHE